MDGVEFLIISYYGYSPKSNVERMQVIGGILKYIDEELSNNSNYREYIEYMLGKKVEALQVSIELSLSMIINRHCEYKL